MSNRRILQRAIERFGNPAERQSYFDLYSGDIVLHGYQGVEPGLENVKQFYAVFWQAFPDAKVTAEEIVEQDDTLVVRHITTGTQLASFMGIASTGRTIKLPGISILHFRNDRCFERWVCSDSLLLLTQLGAFPFRES